MQIENCKLQIESRRAARRGMTLVELLVAISILVILMGIASQMMNLSVDDRRTREAARAVDVYLNSAKNRAIQTGRPCGVLLSTLQGQPEAVVGLQQVEVPPPYAGDTLDAVARLQWREKELVAQMQPQGSFNPKLVKPGDLVQFNHQGPLYTISDRIRGYRLKLSIDLSQGQMLPWPDEGPRVWSAPVPYQIFRRPRKSAAAPLQLPTRAVIDLKASGRDFLPQSYPGGSFFVTSAADEPVIIMFSPTGAIDRIYYAWDPTRYRPSIGRSFPFRVSKPIFLLVGKQGRVANGPPDASAAPPLEELPNWADPENLWIMINPQTGRVTTAENDYVDPAKVDWTDPESWPAHILAARQLAREGQSMGGR